MTFLTLASNISKKYNPTRYFSYYFLSDKIVNFRFFNYYCFKVKQILIFKRNCFSILK